MKATTNPPIRFSASYDMHTGLPKANRATKPKPSRMPWLAVQSGSPAARGLAHLSRVWRVTPHEVLERLLADALAERPAAETRFL